MDAFLVSKFVKDNLKNYKKNSQKVKEYLNEEGAGANSDATNIAVATLATAIATAAAATAITAANSAVVDEAGGKDGDYVDDVVAGGKDGDYVDVDVVVVDVDADRAASADNAVFVNNNTVDQISSSTFILMLLINSYAAYLSWECNTNNNYPLLLKVLFAFFAFMFGSLYIVYYVLFKFDTCNSFFNE